MEKEVGRICAQYTAGKGLPALPRSALREINREQRLGGGGDGGGEGAFAEAGVDGRASSDRFRGANDRA